MASVYDEIDLEWSWNGDFDLGNEKDIKDTSDDGLKSLRQEIHTIVASTLEDWELYPNRGASLDDFVGEPNTRSIGDAIHDRVRISLVSANVVAEEDLELRVIPVHIHKVLIVLKVNAAATPFNRLNENERLIVSLVFDFVEQGTFFFDKTPELIGGQY